MSGTTDQVAVGIMGSESASFSSVSDWILSLPIGIYIYGDIYIHVCVYIYIYSDSDILD